MRASCSTKSIICNGILYPMRIRDLRNFGFNETLFPGQDLQDDVQVRSDCIRPESIFSSASPSHLSSPRSLASRHVPVSRAGVRRRSLGRAPPTARRSRSSIRPTAAASARCPNLGAAETRRAIEAADKALPDWRARTAKERAQILRKWFDLMMANQEDLAVLMTVEQGKPLLESRGEIAYAASFIEWFAEEGKRVYGDVIPASRPRQAHRRAEAADRRDARRSRRGISRRR